MSIQTEKTDCYKITYDDMNPRIYHEEWKCKGCGSWLDDEDVVWATEDGKLTTDKGDAYCDSCLPEEK